MPEVILVGHGHIEQDPGVAGFHASIQVPPGTSIRTYSKVGNQVELPAKLVPSGTGEWGGDKIPDYEVVVKAYKDVGDTTGEGSPVLNYRMEPLTQAGRDLAKAVFGDSCVTPGEGQSFRLCTDPAASNKCPTKMGDDRKHECDGILGKYAGNELFWIACQEIDGFSPSFALGPGKAQLPDGLYEKLQSGADDLSEAQIEALWAHLNEEDTTEEQNGLLKALNVAGY